VGIVRDEGGNDSYLAMRNGEGFALQSGVGIMRDDSGDDTYDYYMPRPLDPGARFQTLGSGGAIDDVGVCDNLSRDPQGVAFISGARVLLDGAGNDHYRV
jgi:hypothetical protein